MIYIYEYELYNSIIPCILKELGIEYNINESDNEELVNLINSKDFEAIFLSDYYSCVLENLDYKKYKQNLFLDFIYQKDNEIIFENLEYLAMKQFLYILDFDFNDKTILLLGSNRKTQLIYKVLKEISNCKIFICSITEEYSKLQPGDRKIKKIEIKNLEKVDCIINATNLGSKNQENECMLEGDNIIKSDFLIDLVYSPIKTTLQRKYETKFNIKTTSGLGICIYRCLIALSLIKNISFVDKYDIIYKKIENKFNDLNINDKFEVN